VKTILHVFWRKIDSSEMPFAHERSAKAASSILLLHADKCRQRFHTARVKSRHLRRKKRCPLYPQ
jgi:hypothetical protein